MAKFQARLPARIRIMANPIDAAAIAMATAMQANRTPHPRNSAPGRRNHRRKSVKDPYRINQVVANRLENESSGPPGVGDTEQHLDRGDQ